MGLDFKITGLDDLEKKMSNLSNNVERLQGNHEIVISDDFVSSHSQFASMKDLLEAGNFESIEKADDDKFDTFIEENTDFASWKEFQSTLANEYITKELGF